MPNKRYLAGRRFEYRIKQQLEKEGWIVFRSAASKGLFDLIGLKIRLLKIIGNRAFFAIKVGFWQLKKNISEEQAIKTLANIQFLLFNTKGGFPIESIKMDGLGSISFDIECPYIKEGILLRFGVIYTLPKKKKLDKRKKRIIKVGKTLQGGEKVAQATSG
jgi:hypothetical protein